MKKLNSFLSKILSVLFLPCCFYIIGAIGGWSLNPGDWHWLIRSVLGFLSTFSFIIACVITLS